MASSRNVSYKKIQKMCSLCSLIKFWDKKILACHLGTDYMKQCNYVSLLMYIIYFRSMVILLAYHLGTANLIIILKMSIWFLVTCSSIIYKRLIKAKNNC